MEMLWRTKTQPFPSTVRWIPEPNLGGLFPAAAAAATDIGGEEDEDCPLRPTPPPGVKYSGASVVEFKLYSATT